MKTRIRSIGKKTLSIFLAFCTIVALLPFMTMTASAASYGVGKPDLPTPPSTISDAAAFVAYVEQFVGDTYTRGRCQMFVQECYLRCFGKSEAGGGCCATNAYRRYCPEENQHNANIPLGAAVYFAGSSTTCSNCGYKAGHVGIYVGNDEIVHVWSGKIQKTTIGFVTSKGYSYRGWGWQGKHVIPQTSANSYSFSFNSNGAAAGTMTSFYASWDCNFTIPKNKFTRSGYVFQGWNAKRNADGKWYVNGQGWLTETAIKNGKYTKALYADGATKKFDASWTRGCTEKSSYTLYAVWQAVPSTLTITGFVGPTGVITKSFGLRGEVKSNYPLTRAYAVLKYADTNQVVTVAGVRYEFDKTWNKASFSIRYDGINDLFAFGKIPPNRQYVYLVHFIDSSGKTLTLETRFTKS